jgi:hypothetical protein
LKEYLSLLQCDDEEKPKIDESKMTPEYMAKLEDRIKQNQAKRKALKENSDIKEFING